MSRRAARLGVALNPSGGREQPKRVARLRPHMFSLPCLQCQVPRLRPRASPLSTASSSGRKRPHRDRKVWVSQAAKTNQRTIWSDYGMPVRVGDQTEWVRTMRTRIMARTQESGMLISSVVANSKTLAFSPHGSHVVATCISIAKDPELHEFIRVLLPYAPQLACHGSGRHTLTALITTLGQKTVPMSASASRSNQKNKFGRKKSTLLGSILSSLQTDSASLQTGQTGQTGHGLGPDGIYTEEALEEMALQADAKRELRHLWYCTHTVLLLYSHCTHTILTLYSVHMKVRQVNEYTCAHADPARARA
jgi:hypothetical protein